MGGALHYDAFSYFRGIAEMKATDNQKHGNPAFDNLWVNASLATMAGAGYGIIENGAVATKGGKIAWVGSMAELEKLSERGALMVHDVNGKWLTPGLIDCHTHLVYAGNRANEFAMRLEGKSYAEISKAGGGIASTMRAVRAADESELFAASEKRLHQLLNEGVTSIEIKSGYGLDTENELKMLRVARNLGNAYAVSVYTTFLGAHAVPPEYAGKADDYINMICNEMMPAVAKEKLADAVDAYCESIAFSIEQVTKLFNAARRFGIPVKLHAGQLTDMGGAQLAASYQALSAEHLEHISEDGVSAMSRAKTVAVLLPGAYYMLKEVQRPPVDLFRKHHVPVALATDCNPGTSPVCSLLLMLNMGCILFGLTPEEALLGVTRNAAQALGIANKVGTLEKGKDADLALWDIAHPSELSYHLGYNPCMGVIRHGKFINIRERLA
jgi:imidazolonepropionase